MENIDRLVRARQTRSGMIVFTVYTKPEPQGSIRMVPTRSGARLTSSNENLKPYRHTVTQVARMEMSRLNKAEPMAAKQIPLAMQISFTFRPPKSAPGRKYPVVKPDLDKLLRATLDALTGVLYDDDAQVVQVTTEKVYGPVEQVHISAMTL